MSRILLLLALISQLISLADADVYHCKNENGKTSFQDTECSPGGELIEQFGNVEAENVADFGNEKIELDKSFRTIYKGSHFGHETRFVNIAIIEETDEYLLLEVTGYFSGSPRGKMQFRAVPNTKWRYSGNVHATERGFVKEYTRISLNPSANDTEESDIFSLQLWHYSLQNKASRLKMITVPFKKTWRKERN